MKAFLTNRYAQLASLAIALCVLHFTGTAPADLAIGLVGATLAAGQLTLADWAKRQDPNGAIATVAELLSQTNEILEDAVFIEGNLPTGHRFTQRTSLPSVGLRALNQGVATSKSTTAQIDEACAIIEARSHVDKELAMLNGQTAAFRMSEDQAFLEAMNQQAADMMFFGNTGLDPKTINGLQTRYNALTGTVGQNVMSAGGSGSDNASVYLVLWGPETVFCPFPKGAQAGLSHQDLGEESVQDANGNWYQALRTLYQWKLGMAVKDWRYVVRIANIDVSDWLGVTGTQATTAATNLINLMSRALDRIPNFAMGRAAFYMNRSIYSGLRVQSLARSQNAVVIQQAMNQFGTPQSWAFFQGVPLRKVDRLGIAETVVT